MKWWGRKQPMKIDKVILQNIGVYANRNEIDLQSDKPIVLIGGMNGRGKTTFLDAIMFALYGKRAIGSGQALEAHLRKISNVSGIGECCVIELHFSVLEQELVTYQIRRFWNLKRKQIKLETQVKRNGIADEVLSENWDLFVEEILPRAIAPFFFFDGERMAELASSDHDSHIHSSIRSLLGIDIIDQLILDLQSVMSVNQKKITDTQYTKQLDDLEGQLEVLEKTMEEKQLVRQEKEQHLKELQEELVKLENEHVTVGGNYAEYRDQFQRERSELVLQMETNQTQLLELASFSLPLRMVGSLLDDVKKNAKEENEQRELLSFIRQFPVLHREYGGDLKWDDKLQRFYETVQEHVKETKPVYDLDENERTRLQELPDILEQEYAAVDRLIRGNRTLEKKKKKIDNYLAVQVADEKIADIYKHMKEKSLEEGKCIQQIELIDKELAEIRTSLESIERRRRLIFRQVVQEMDEVDENRRMISYAQIQTEIFRKYKGRLQALKADELANQMTMCFEQLVAKEGLICQIKIDHDTLAFRYYGRNGEQIDNQRLSSGEKQLLVIAMLWALGICSKSQFPLIIDTPLARLDSQHRISLIENYFPKASEQVIILSTDQEIIGDDYERLKQHVGKEYTLIYDEETMSTSIQSGYFGRSNS